MTQLQTEIDKLKAGFARLKTVWLIAFGVAFVLLVLLLFTVFKGKGKPDESYKLEIERLQQQVNILQQSNSLRDSIIKQHDQRLQENRKTETIIKHHYDQISVDVPKLNNNQLRDEITNY